MVGTAKLGADLTRCHPTRSRSRFVESGLPASVYRYCNAVRQRQSHPPSSKNLRISHRGSARWAHLSERRSHLFARRARPGLLPRDDLHAPQPGTARNRRRVRSKRWVSTACASTSKSKTRAITRSPTAWACWSGRKFPIGRC